MTSKLNHFYNLLQIMMKIKLKYIMKIMFQGNI
jgi:hypothetical protein